MGDGRSDQTLLMEPGCICSKPITRQQSIAPFLIKVRARCRPVEPVAHALFVLYIGMLDSEMSANDTFQCNQGGLEKSWCPSRNFWGFNDSVIVCRGLQDTPEKQRPHPKIRY